MNLKLNITACKMLSCKIRHFVITISGHKNSWEGLNDNKLVLQERKSVGEVLKDHLKIRKPYVYNLQQIRWHLITEIS